MQKRLQIQEIVGVSEKSAWSMEGIIKSVHSWVLEMPWSFVFMSPCLFPQSLSCYLPPVTSFVVVLWVRFVSMCCGQLWHMRMEQWHLDGLSVLPCFLFSGGWDLRVCSLAVNKKHQKTAIYWLFSLTSGHFRYMSQRNQKCQKKSVGPAFQCHHGSRRKMSTNTLNKED